MKKIPYGQHYLDSSDIEAVVKILESEQITQGKTVEEFGQALADYAGAKYGIALSSGTAALHISLVSAGIEKGDEVITTPMTFCATANVALYQGAEVKFVDIDEKTLNINPKLIEEKITKKTKAIIPVDFRGHPANLPEIKLIAEKYNLKVIEDGSHSIGSKYTYDGKKYNCGDGIHSDLCTYSFHPVKHITTGEGGAILTNDEELYRKAFFLTKHGIDRREEMFNEEERKGAWIYDMEKLGYNYRITDFQAALGLNQLKKIDKLIERRRYIVDFYNEKFSKYDEFILPFEDLSVVSNFHIYTLQIKENNAFDRYDFFNYLKEKNYLPMVHYIPVHLLTYYRNKFGYKRGDFPCAELYYDRTISLPLYPSLSDSQIEKVVTDIQNYVEKMK